MVGRLTARFMVAGLAFLTALIFSLASGPSRVPTAWAQTPTPADTLVGQQVMTCNEGTQFNLAVTSTLWTKTIQGESAKGNGMWLAVFYDVTNLGTTRGAVAGTIKLADERGRGFRPDNPGGPLIGVLSDQYGVGGSYSGYDPGITQGSFELFQVASDAQSLTLLADPFECD